jgi:hypothetical protein
MSRNVNGFRRQLESASRGAMVQGGLFAAAILAPAKAFADLETASTQLKNTLMTSDGLSTGFKELNDIAMQLGNQLPGTTADFANLESKLKALGVSTEDLINGGAKAAAYLAVIGAPLGVTYDSAAEAVGKLSNAFGIAGKDLVPFADTLQRTLHMGIDLTQMQYAMARVAGPLKEAGLQGANVANEIAPLVAMLIKVGVTGEEAGTGLKKMLEVGISTGKFTGVSSLVDQLDKINKMPIVQRAEQLTKLFGENHQAKAALINRAEYDKTLSNMKAQADMQQRINTSLGTLTNLWEAATGTFTNAMAAFGAAYGPQLKQLAVTINTVSDGLMRWNQGNGPLILSMVKWVGLIVASRVAMAGLAIALGAIATTLSPVGLAFTGISIAIALVADNFGMLVDRFKSGINNIVSFFQPLIDTVAALGRVTGNLFGGFSMPSFQGPGTNSMRKPQSLIKSSKVSGGIDVNFNNAPAGMRVNSQTKGLSVTPNVGYRSLGMAQ